MAGAKQYSSTQSKFTPFSSGVQDYRLGLVENAVLMKIKDENLGTQTYFSMRPSMSQMSTTLTTDNSPPLVDTVGNFISAADRYYSTNLNMYMYGVSRASKNYGIAFGGDSATAWQTEFGITSNKAPTVEHDYTTTGDKFITVVGPKGTTVSKLFVLNITGGVPADNTGTVYELPFLANQWSVSMDGYLFIAHRGTDTIYNSDLNDYTTWDIDVNLIRASQFPGSILALGRINNYIIAYKENSIEFFFNAGLSSTSPLQRNTSYTRQIGLTHTGSLVSVNNNAYFVGKDQFGARKVYHMSETACDVISTPAIEASLSSFPIERDTSLINSFYLSLGGKKFYVLQNLYNSISSLVYDIDEQVWYSWNAVETFLGTPTPIQLPIRYCLSLNDSFYSLSDGPGVTCLGTSPLVGTEAIGAWFVSYSNASQSTKDVTFSGYVLDGEDDWTATYVYNSIVTTLYLPPTDFGTVNRKFIRELSISGFAPSNINHEITVSKYTGGENQTEFARGTNSNNLNFKNWGSAINFGVKYKIYEDLTNIAGFGRSAQNLRLYGINYDVSMGVS